MDDGVGYYRVNSTNVCMSCCLRKGTDQVVYRLYNSLTLYDTTVTGKNAGSSSVDEQYTGIQTWSNVGAQFGQFDSDTFVAVHNYTSSPYQVRVETYRIGTTPSSDIISQGTTAIPYYSYLSNGSQYSWCLAALKRNQIDIDGNNNYVAIWHRYLIFPKLSYSRRYGWTGSAWEVDNTTSRNIPKTATHTLPNGLSVDFNNATGGATWDQQFIATEHFNYVHGPFVTKDNLQTLQIKARNYFCQALVVESYGTTVPSSAPYEITIPEVSDPNFRDMDTVDFVTEIFEGGTQYDYYDPTGTTYTVSAATDILAVGTSISTGTAVLVYNSNMTNPTYIPAPLEYPRIYYAINISSTEIKLAETYADAIATTAIDITTNGTYTQYIKQIIPTTETYRPGLQGVFVFSSADAGNSVTLTYTYTKFTT